MISSRRMLNFDGGDRVGMVINLRGAPQALKAAFDYSNHYIVAPLTGHKNVLVTGGAGFIGSHVVGESDGGGE